MPLAIGTRIGPYEVTGWLGAGGMGEVYRARDPRIGRDVAIKLIRDSLASDRARVSRFELEAKAAGQINHPNILAVYDVGTHAGVPFIVSELLEGESLRTRLAGGALAPKKAVEYARQIADGLEAAHDRGIVHRDLKPENLFITADGRLKILDFGIAKLTRASDNSAAGTAIATETQDGMVVGTVGYMSPEQVRGEPVDHRSDLFNFGAVFYEMLTGRVAFTRGTAADTMAAILKEDPVAPLPASVPPALARTVTRCLEKSREARFQSARDLAFGLEVLSGEHTAATGQIGNTAGSAKRVVRWAVSAVVAALTILIAVFIAQYPGTPSEPYRHSVPLPAGQALDGSGSAHTLRISRDGQQLAYVATPDRLYLLTLGRNDAKPIPGTDTAESVREPVFSDNGRQIVFFASADRSLQIMSTGGGASRRLCSAQAPTGMSWGPDGTILFGQGSKGIWRVSPAAGNAEQIITVADGEIAHGPELLPGGRHVLFTVAKGMRPDRWERAHIVVQEVGSSAPRSTVIESGTDAHYLSSGYIVYYFRGSIYAVGFDPVSRRKIGEPVRVQDDVARAMGNVTGAAMYSVSDAGHLIYVPGAAATSTSLRQLALMDRQGVVEPLKPPPAPYAWPRVSPDGTHLAFGNDDSDDDKPGVVKIYDLSETRPPIPLEAPGSNRYAIWADNRQVIFQSKSDGGEEALFLQAVDGTPPRQLTTPAAGESHEPESVSGDTLLFSITVGTKVSLATLSLRTGVRTAYRSPPSSTPMGATFSADGRLVAFASTSEEQGTTLYVQAFPDNGTIAAVPKATATDTPKYPRWLNNELFYDPWVNRFESVPVNTTPGGVVFGGLTTVPKLLRFAPIGERTMYDVIQKGKHAGKFVGTITPNEKRWVRASLNNIEVVRDWSLELRAKVPSR
jgi:serine/threonine-protein kinase